MVNIIIKTCPLPVLNRPSDRSRVTYVPRRYMILYIIDDINNNRFGYAMSFIVATMRYFKEMILKQVSSSIIHKI